MKALGRQNEAYCSSLKQAQESRAEAKRKLAEALELQADFYAREVALQVQVAGLQELVKADAETQKDLKDRFCEQTAKVERIEEELATQAKAMDLLRVDYNELQVEVSRLRVEKEALEKQVASGDAAIEELEKEKNSLIQEMAAEELKKQTEELKKQAEELKQQNEGQQKQIEDLELSSAQILAAGFEAAREQFACLFPDLDLTMVSLNNEVVDGKVVPAED
ncbi:uncharacterized protein [Phaseolus vulgaris]|uniref:uncharacterized protein n=1 Tax=Phaseolus vulgaris TaxID=3885 RepID=UPI0035CB361B